RPPGESRKRDGELREAKGVGRCFLVAAGGAGASERLAGVSPSTSPAFMRYSAPASPPPATPLVRRTQNAPGMESKTSATSVVPRALRTLRRRAGRSARAESACAGEAKPAAVTVRYFSSSRATAPESAGAPCSFQVLPARCSV